ncbi:MarC family protein [Coralliovum pocilloporae]|uniref:MarC family protein n=1 Tax=Coralliovum pocilloporae TaxID=3066369 RepID=UPI0033071B55
MSVDVLIHALITLFVTIDPIGMAPLFLAVTAGMDDQARKQVAIRAFFISTSILLAFAFLGSSILSAIGITLPAFRIAGGLLLFWIAFEMVFERRQARKSKSAERAVTMDEIRNVSVFPLSIPLIAGPGAISAIILLSASSTDWVSQAEVILALVLMTLAVLAVFLIAPRIEKILGETGRVVLTRLLGLLLAALSVQFVADGIAAFIQQQP